MNAPFNLDARIGGQPPRCPHKAGPPSQGVVPGHAVTCRLHNGNISPKTGEAPGESVTTKSGNRFLSKNHATTTAWNMMEIR